LEKTVHIPDGMLDTKTFGTLWVGAAGGIAYASYWIRKNFDSSKVVLMAVMAALIFALQMLNFPIAGGTSGHFAGGALAGIMLGAWPGAIVMTGVLLIQALFFGDGGITTLGANIVNLAIIGCFAGSLIYQLFQRISKGSASKIAGASVGAFLAVVLSSVAVALELWASGSAQFLAALTAMVFWHTIIGIGEGIITGGIIAYVVKVRPQILEEGAQNSKGTFKSVALVFGVVALIAAGLSFLASAYPDGLEYVYHEMGIGTAPIAEASLVPAPLFEYMLPGVQNNLLARIGAGIVGTLVAGVLIWAVAVSLSRSWEDKLAPHAKIVAAVILVLGIVLSAPHTLIAALGLVLIILFLAYIARANIGRILLFSLIVIPIAGAISLFYPLRFAVDWQWESLLEAYAAHWPAMLQLIVTPWLCVLVMMLLVHTTTRSELLFGLERLHLPKVLVLMLSFMYRYVDVMRSQLHSAHRALVSRAPTLSRRRRVLLYGNLAGSMIIRAYDRGERINAAMLSRGFTGTLPLAEPRQLCISDALLLATASLLAVSLILMHL